jgi:uncharacterized protein (TIGR03067 family)
MTARWLIVLTVAVLCGPARGEEKTTKESAKLAGDWRVTAATSAGWKLGERWVQGLGFAVTGTEFTLSFAGLTVMQGSFTIDLDKTPKTIDLKSTLGDQQGKTLAGIYEVNGDTLKICYCMDPAGKRPKEFSSTHDNKAYLLVCMRQEPGGPEKRRAPSKPDPKEAELKWAKEVASDFLTAGLHHNYPSAETLVTADFKKALKEGNDSVTEQLKQVVIVREAESWVITCAEIAPDQDEALFRGAFKGKKGEVAFSVRVAKEKEGGKWRVCFFTAGEYKEPEKDKK